MIALVWLAACGRSLGVDLGSCEAPSAAVDTGVSVEVGLASWYGGGESLDAETASGEPFDPNALAAAHPTLPFGSVVEVTRLSTGQQVTAVVNDRGPYEGNRIVDLTRAAAARIGLLQAGVDVVQVEVVDRPDH
jgi:rare lipoprotein A